MLRIEDVCVVKMLLSRLLIWKMGRAKIRICCSNTCTIYIEAK
jgi:hypothetical protein